ncbi:MAG: hypothetical protein H0T15_07440, partial [Thermoleophilaceae bacterium]|nr:hypothetical protein [Thermoleophilaceae bacterium]
GALLAIYTSQELVEGLLSPGHPAGIAGVIGHGGWIAIALALPLGAGIAFLLRAAEALIANRKGATSRAGRRGSAPSVPRRPEHHRSLDTVARHLAGRAPPLLSSQ